jgi:hypothetical protein
LTNLPVALTVSHGNHGWILTGFRASADPAATSSFTVTSVRVTGPLYGLQSKNGYDMPPNTKLTTAQLKRFFTPWKYAPRAMIWDGRYVSIQPIPPTSAAATGATSTPSVAPPTPLPSPSALASSSLRPSEAPSQPSSRSPAPAVAIAASSDPAPSTTAAAVPDPVSDRSPGPIGLIVVLAIIGMTIIAIRFNRRRPA